MYWSNECLNSAYMSYGINKFNLKQNNEYNISLNEFNSLLNESCKYLNMKAEFYPSRWRLIESSNNKYDSLSYYKFCDIYNKYEYTVTREKILVEIFSRLTYETINVNIPIPENLWYQIQYCINNTKSMIEQANHVSKFENKNYKISKLYEPVKSKKIDTNNKTLTKEEKELVSFLESIQEKSFDEIFSSIVKYRLQKYNKGQIDDVAYPYDKTKQKLRKLKKVLLSNNYEQFNSLKKWADKVIFVDNNEK